MCSIPEAHESCISALVVSSDGLTVVSGATDGSTHCWKLAASTGMRPRHQKMPSDYQVVLSGSVSIQEDHFRDPRTRKGKSKKHARQHAHTSDYHMPGIAALAAEAECCLEM